MARKTVSVSASVSMPLATFQILVGDFRGLFEDYDHAPAGIVLAGERLRILLRPGHKIQAPGLLVPLVVRLDGGGVHVETNPH